MNRTDAEEFLSGFSGGLPSALEERYEGLECLSYTEFGETFLLRRKTDDKLIVAKNYAKKSFGNAQNEKEILAGLDHDSLPAYVETIESDEFIFILREYAEGQPLDYWRGQHKPAVHQAIQIAVKICDVLSYLHDQTPPVIHRDIKPSNIIINGDKICLIDFGISRLYDKDSRRDTMIMGTQGFASPEQYGFLQTDSKSDIYAAGVLLYYLMTGEIDLTPSKIADKSLWHIISKCTAFSPKARFRNAAALKNALVGYQNRMKKNIFAVAAVLIIACIVLFAGFAIGRYTDILQVVPPAAQDIAESPYVFTDPLIEKAVRLTLGKGEGETVFRHELKQIEELYFVEDTIAFSDEEYRQLRLNYTLAPETPDYCVKRLDDIKELSNLQVLKICTFYPAISDVSPLAQHSRLIDLDIIHSNISDVSPLATIPYLKILTLYKSNIDDFSYFGEMKSLRELNIGGTPLKNIANLCDMSKIESLHIDETNIRDLNGIEKIINLESLNISNCRVTDFSPLNSLPHLKKLYISSDMEQYLNTLSRDDVEIVIR